MGHRPTEWFHRLSPLGICIAATACVCFGFGFLKTMAIVLPLFVVLLLVVIAMDPGPRAKGFVERMRNRLR